MIATFTWDGYVLRVCLASHRAQNRGGKGKSGLSLAIISGVALLCAL